MPELAAPVLPADFAWRQSIITRYLTCPRAFYLQHVAQVAPDHTLDGYASIAGAACHHAAAQILTSLQLGEGPPSRDELENDLQDGFMRALEQEQEAGATTDPDRVQAALERLLTDQLELVVALANDPRLRAIQWRGVEEEFSYRDPFGRGFEGHIDAWGVAYEAVRDFGAGGLEVAHLAPGDVIVVDWKTGSEGPALDWPSRSLNVQLALYAATLGEVTPGAPVRAFLGVLRDLERPQLPKDDAGESIPKRLKKPNPAFVAAVGIDPAAGPAHEKTFGQCLKKPKDAEGKAIPKWLETENPAWVAATSRPKGPVFHECRLDGPVVSQTVADAIDGARLGLFPASGALNGECRRCPFRARCAHRQGAP